VIAVLSLIFFTAILLTAPIAAYTNPNAAEVSAGLPTVTSDQFISKINRLVGAIYSDLMKIAPQITLLIIVLGAIVGIFWREARGTVIWSIGALLLIMWAPQIIGLVIHYINI
jgi:hypothetical protein